MKQLLIIGARGFGREIYGLAQACIEAGADMRVKGFLDDKIDALDGYKNYPPIISSVEAYEPEEEVIQESKLTEVELDGLNKLIEEKESFGIFVYLPGCTSCAAFSIVLDDFLKDNQVVFYKTQIKYAKETEIGSKIKYAPSFVVFKEGKVVSYLDAESDKDKPVYETKENFKEWLTKYINLK